MRDDKADYAKVHIDRASMALHSACIGNDMRAAARYVSDAIYEAEKGMGLLREWMAIYEAAEAEARGHASQVVHLTQTPPGA